MYLQLQGGVKAVVYTDVLQTSLMFGGILLVTAKCCIELSGIDQVITISAVGRRLEIFK